MRKNNKALYESIMSKVRRVVKQALNEDQIPYMTDNNDRKNPEYVYKRWFNRWGNIARKCLTQLEKLNKIGLIGYSVDDNFFKMPEQYGEDFPIANELSDDDRYTEYDYTYEEVMKEPKHVWLWMKKPLKHIGSSLYKLNDEEPRGTFKQFLYNTNDEGDGTIWIRLDQQTYDILRKINVVCKHIMSTEK